MIRRLMASTAVLALITAAGFGIAEAQTEPAEQPAAAQQDATSTDQGAAPAADAAAEQPAPPPPEDQSAASEQPADATATAGAEAEATLTPERPTIASAFMGQSVFSSEDPDSDNIGDVKDLIISDDGMITHAVVGVGGFLGIGEKEVAVPFDELQVVEEEDGDIRLIYAATREQLEAAEPFDRAAYDPEARAAEEQQAAAEAEAEATSGAAGGVTPAPAGDIAAAPAPAEEPEAEAEEPAEMTAAEPAEPVEAEAEQPAETTAAEPAAETEQQTTAEVQTEPAAETEQQTTVEVQPAPAEGTDQQQTAQVETEAAAGTETQAIAEFDPESGFVSFSADQIRASTMMGQEIFGPDGDSIGEVSDLVLQEDGETRAALIDVGGFLGVGEKEVAIPFEQIEVQAGENGEEPRLVVAMTREELEQLPNWEDPADMAEADQTGTVATDQQETTTVVTTEQPEQPAGEAVETAGTEAGEAEQQMPAGQMAEVGAHDLSAENLIGAAIYSPEDEAVGEVGDVIFDQGGSIQAVIVDVGGFLGVGEKAVAIQFDALNVQKDTEGDLRLMVNATQEQLENAPTYEVGEQPAQ